VSRIILICRGRGREGAVDASIEPGSRLGTVPMLFLRRDRPAAEIVPLIADFLA
jgi:hypothetical protein